MQNVTAPQFTLNDYMQLPEGFPAELIDGMLVKEPSPTYWHQELVGRFYLELRRRFPRVAVSPIDFFIDDLNVLQPDLAILPDDTPLGPEHERMPVPRLVIEVLSPATALRDRHTKTEIYLRAGVAEIWLVDPATESVEIVTSKRAWRAEAGTTAHAKTLELAVELPELFRTIE